MIECRQKTNSEVSLKRRFRSALSLVHGILFEFYSFFGRIGILYRNNLHRSGIPLGPTWEKGSNKHLRKSIATQLRIRGIRTMLSIHPKASLVDLFLTVRLVEALHSLPVSFDLEKAEISDRSSRLRGYACNQDR